VGTPGAVVLCGSGAGGSRVRAAAPPVAFDAVDLGEVQL